MADNKTNPDWIPGATAAENAIFSKKKFYLHLKHLPSQQEIKFKAMLTQFEDQYTSDWNMEQVFGRMDPIRSFRGTQRIITLGWDVVAASVDEAKFNLRNCSTFLSMLYPSYSAGSTLATARQTATGTKDREKSTRQVTEQKQGKAAAQTGNAATIEGAPLFKLKFANLIQSATAGGEANHSIDSGLIGSVDGLTYSPDVEQGFFDTEPGVLYPQTIRLSFAFHVAHDHPLGWSDRSFRDGLVFPYPPDKGGK